MQVGGQGFHGGNGTEAGKGLGLQLANSQIITIDIIIGIGNICLLIFLLFMYLRSYRDFKSKFTFGLVAFALLLLLQNILFTGFLLTYQGFRGPGMGAPIFFLNIIEFFALSILIGVTWE
ncbi:hypothetical protein Metbo_0028 [Methanobacterium lacus]|uniref:Uncharacterized protein n=1 Tax=Methanobacterium lacus (strain AL-21) TaxID=877455 RepID=F0T6P8_METLA|nr:hypothetical protein [Methanobacterium lacus]ADZ08281.1 hypothetical protein Metbo_0028 [Methanobacterium lacus]UTB33938.1 MAG: hypothetical protein NKF70_07055 [Methanobacterium sp. ERen5]